MKALARASLVVVLVLASATATAAPDAGVPAPADAGASAASPPAADAGAPAASGECTDVLPPNVTRPVMSDTYPSRAPSGWAALLSVTIQHGKGERVLPAGLENAATTEAKKRLRTAGFALPSQSGPSAGKFWTEPEDKSASTLTSHVELPLVPLPEQPGRQALTVPPLPIAIARANGEIMTLCTRPHVVLVEDPTANDPDAKPRPNPPARPEREEWTALKTALTWIAIGLVVGGALAWAYRWWRARPVPPPPAPPPRPPWEVALEKLAAVRAGTLLDEERHAEYIDLVSEAVRGYLGARFGFDGLESTTDEILAALRVSAVGFVWTRPAGAEAAQAALFAAGVSMEDIQDFLGQCDLVKFAGMRPSTTQCTRALTVGQRIVRATMPVARVADPSDPPREETR